MNNIIFAYVLLCKRLKTVVCSKRDVRMYPLRSWVLFRGTVKTVELRWRGDLLCKLLKPNARFPNIKSTRLRNVLVLVAYAVPVPMSAITAFSG